MDRRQFNSIPLPLLAAVILLAQQRAQAFSIDNLCHAEASQGLKMAL